MNPIKRKQAEIQQLKQEHKDSSLGSLDEMQKAKRNRNGRWMFIVLY